MNIKAMKTMVCKACMLIMAVKPLSQRFFLLSPMVMILMLGCGPGSPQANTNAPVEAPVESEKDGSPELADYSVWRPFFFTTFGNHATDEICGSAFAVKLNESDQAYLVTALHLLGPETGLSEQIKPGKIRESIETIVVNEAFGASDSMVTVALPLELDLDLFPLETWLETDALLIPGGPGSKRFKPIPISDDSVLVGDVIWLGAGAFGGAPASDKTHEATVTAVSDSGQFDYVFKNKRLSLKGADGAPLLSSDGSVVGMHLRPLLDSADVVGRGVSATKFKEQFTKLLASE